MPAVAFALAHCTLFAPAPPFSIDQVLLSDPHGFSQLLHHLGILWPVEANLDGFSLGRLLVTTAAELGADLAHHKAATVMLGACASLLTVTARSDLLL